MSLHNKILYLLNFLLIILTQNFIQAQNIIKIKIFSGINVNTAIFKVNAGKYAIINSKDTICKILPGEHVTFSINNEKIRIEKNKHTAGIFNEILIIGLSFRNSFQIIPDNNKNLQRTYDNNLVIKKNNADLLLINYVDLENYVAGVVEAETGGISDNEEFFKVQAIISRTYAVGHLNNHKEEGYNLCDGVHCQSYKGQASKNVILKAVYATQGSVLADSNYKLITAAYHSNSGGLTVGSGDLWNKQLPYLISINDTFSINGSQAKWEIKMKKQYWLDFLDKEFHFPTDDSTAVAFALNFTQDSTRNIYFYKNITLKSIREKLGLRSTWFSVIDSGDDIIIKGKGYGHGVGLSQEGAAIMAASGYSYDEILKFYYKGVQIIKKDKLKF